MHLSAKDPHNPAKTTDIPGPPPGLLVAGHVTRCYRRTVVRTHGTNDWLLTYTLGGRACYRQPGAYFEVGAGDLVLLEPGAYHHYAPLEPEGWDSLWAHFVPRPTWLGALVLPSAGKGLYRLHITDGNTRNLLRAALFRCIKHANSIPARFGQELALNALEEVVWLVARENAFAAGDRRLSPDIRRVIEHLAETLAEAHTLEGLARVAHLSPSRLTHRFKEETGDAVIAYLLKLRLHKAARLLEFSGQSVKEVALEVGFASPFYFTRQFRKHFSMSPRAYRQRLTRPPAGRTKRQTST